jgi:hypothetical protein
MVKSVLMLILLSKTKSGERTSFDGLVLLVLLS